MKVFVTGATGVLGQSAIAALLPTATTSPDSPATTRRRPSSSSQPAPTRSTVQLFDQAEPDRGVLDGFDAVCNLATHIPIGSPASAPAPGRSTTGCASRAPRSSCRPRTTPAYGGSSRRVSPSCTPMAATSDHRGEPAGGDPGRRAGGGRREQRGRLRSCHRRQPVDPAVRQVHRRRPDDPLAARPGHEPVGRSASATRRAGHTSCTPTTRGPPSPSALDCSGRRLQRRRRADPPRRDDERVRARRSAATSSGSCPGWWSKLAGERLEPLTRSQRVSSDQAPRGHRLEAAARRRSTSRG